VGAWVDASAHTAYIVVEADSAQKLEELLAPGLEIGYAETSPVQDGLEILKIRGGTN
jgi:hypothetical protein